MCNLQLFIDDGQIIATGAGGLSFEFRYTLILSPPILKMTLRS